jgi:hypothetical protein
VSDQPRVRLHVAEPEFNNRVGTIRYSTCNGEFVVDLVGDGKPDHRVLSYGCVVVKPSEVEPC